MAQRFTTVSFSKTEDGHAIQLDGRTIKTPHGQPLASPNKPLAQGIVAEWEAQKSLEQIHPESLPLTQILNTALDRMRDRVSLTTALLKYLDTDLLCYRTKEPEALSAAQKEVWDRWLNWFDDHFETPLQTTFGLDALTQSKETHKRIWNYLEALDEYYFTILQIVTSLSGSIVLGLAFLEREATPEEIFAAAELEEIYYAKIAGEGTHGSDPVQERRQAAMKRDMDSARRFLDLLDAE